MVPIERDLHASVAALAAIAPGPHWVVSCYLKLEPRDKTRGKYLIKMKNRVRETVTALARRPLERADREAIAADLGRVLEYFEDPGRLPSTRGIAVFASHGLRLFEALALPHVHRSRLGVDRVPLVRELVALEEEFGTILVAACDRTAARFFEVTAFDCVELTSLAGIDASRGSRFHAAPSGSAGEHNYHTRIRAEKQRLYAHVADRIFQIHSQRPLTGLVVAGVGVDAGAVVPHLHTYLHDLVLGVVKLNPKQATAAEVREATLALREERERAWERAHADDPQDPGARSGAHPPRRRPGRRPPDRRRRRRGAAPARSGGRALRRQGAPGGGRLGGVAAVPRLMPKRRRPIRILVAKPGLDGHDRGAKVVAAALRDAGMEVIYTGLHQTPEMIAQAAIQEDVDVVGLSILSGAHMTLFPRVRKLLDAAGRQDVLLTGGGIIPPEDMTALERQGAGKLFGPGTPTSDLIKYIQEWAAAHVAA